MATATVEPTIMSPRKPPASTEQKAVKPAADTLIGKIAEACNAVGGIEKRGRNQKHNYDYVMAADVAAAFRHELFERGIILLIEEESADFHEYTTQSGGMMQECRLRMKFTLTDGSANVVSVGYGVGRDTFDKAVYKAKTGATKYFLRGLGLIPDRADDPEDDKTEEAVRAPERQQPGPAPIQPQYPPRLPVTPARPSQPVGSITPFDKNVILSAVKKSGKSSQQLTAFLHTNFGYDALDEMPKRDLKDALKWAMEA